VEDKVVWLDRENVDPAEWLGWTITTF